jgi:hypothetical protein
LILNFTFNGRLWTMPRRARCVLFVLSISTLAGTAAAESPPPALAPTTGPQIELPAPEPALPSLPPPPSLTLNDLAGSGRRLGLGGYGEALATFDEHERRATLRRFVLFAGYQFADWLRLYSELEVENTDEIEMEQAYVELAPRRWLGMRAGLVLVPVGSINLFHEPPVFANVERPLLEQLIIPSTWRELGVGIYGMPIEGLHYQLYAVAGLDADKLRPRQPLVGASAGGHDAHLEDAAVTGRVNYNRVLGLDIGFSFYYGGAGQDVKALAGVRVAVLEADARFKRWGLDVRAEYARVLISGAGRVTDVVRDKQPTLAAIPRAADGCFMTIGYDVLRPFKRTRHALMPFVHYDYVNPAAALPNVLAPGREPAMHFLAVGIDYRPHPQVVLKVDYRRRLDGPRPAQLPSALRVEDGPADDRFGVGLGFMF